MELFGSTSILPLLLGIRRQIQSVLATSRVPIFNSGSPPTSSRNSNCCRSGALPCLATTGLYSLCSSRLFKIAQEIATLGAPKRKAPAGGWGARGAGALIFETKTHPVTAGIMIEERIGSPPYELNWIACIPLLLLLAAASRLRIVFGLALRSRAQEDDGTAQRSGIGMNRSILASIHRPPRLQYVTRLTVNRQQNQILLFKASACRMPTPSARSSRKSTQTIAH